MLTEQASRLTLADPETTEPARKEPFASAQEGIRLQPRPTCVACHGETAAFIFRLRPSLRLRSPLRFLRLLLHIALWANSLQAFVRSFCLTAAILSLTFRLFCLSELGKASSGFSRPDFSGSHDAPPSETTSGARRRPASSRNITQLQKLRLEGGSAGAGDPQPQEEDRLKSHRESPPEKAKEPSVTALLVCESPETSAGEEGRFAQRQSCKDEVSAFRQSATRPLILGSEQSSPDSRGAASLTSSLRPNRTPALSLFVFKGDAAGGLTRARVTFSPAASLPLSSGSSGHPLASSPPLDGALEASPRERPETEQAHPARRRGVWGTGAHAVCVEVVEEGIVLISGENTEAGRLAEPRRDASTGPVASLAFFPPSWQLSSCSRRSEQDASWDMRPEAGDDATRALKDAWFADSHSLWKGEGEEAVGGGRAEIGQRRGRPAKDLLVVSGQRRNVAVWGACGTQQLSIHPIGSRPHAGTFASVLAPDVLSPAQQTLASSGAAQGFGKDPRDASRLQTVAIFSARPGGRVWVADSNSGSVQTTLRLAPTNAASSRSSSSFAESEGRRPGASRVNGKDGEGQRKEETAASKPPREASELASGTRPALHRLSHLTGSCFLSWSTVEDTNFPCSAFSSSASETLTARKQAGAGPVCGESPRSGTSASASPPSWPETGRQPGGAEERPAPGSLRAGLDALTDTLSPTRSIASPLQPTAPQQASHLHMRDDVGLSLSSPSSRACLPPQLPTAFAGEKPAGTRALWKEDGAEHSGRRGEAVATGGALETKTEAVASSSVAERVLLVDVGKIRVRREWRLPGGAVHAAVHAHVGGLEALFLVAGPAESRGRRGSSSDGISSQQRGETATARGDRDGQARGAARERKATRDEAPDGEAAMTLGDAGASAHQRIDAPDNEERRTAEEMGTPAAGFAAVDGAEGTWLREEGRVGVALDDRCFLLCTLAFGEHKRVVATQLLSALGAAFPAEAHAWRTPGGRRPSLSETSRETHRIGRECPDATRRSGGLQTGTGFQAGFPENGGAWRHDSIRPEEPCPGLTRRTPSPDRPSSFPLSAPLPLPVSVSLEAFDSDPENETLFLSSPSVLVDQGGPENRRRDRDDSAGGVGFLGSNAHWNGHLIRLPPPLVSSSCSSSFYALSPPSPILDSCNLRIQDLSLSLTGWTEAALAYCLAYAVDESALLSDWSIPAVFLRSRRFAPARASSHNLGQERGGPSDLSSPFSPFSSSSFPLPSHALPLSSPTASRAGRGDVSPLDALKNRDSGVSFSTSSSGRRPSAVPEGSLAELASRRAHAVLRFLLPLIRVAAPMLEMPLFSSVSVSAAQARSGLEFNSPLRGLRTDQREAESRSWKGGETRENVQEVGGKTAESAGFQEGEKRQEGGVLETSRRWGVEHRVGHHAGGQKADRCESTSRGPEVSLFFCPSFFRTYFAPQGCTAPVPGDSFFAAQTYLPVSVKETTVSSSVPLSSFLSLLRHFAATVEALEALTCATVASAASFPLRNFPPARPVSASRVRQRVACQPHTPKTRSSSASSSSSLSPESAEDGALGQAEVQCAGEAEISNVETKPLDDAAALFSASREMHAHRDDLRGPEPAPREGPRNASVAFPREGSDPGVSAGGLLHTVAAASHAATTALLGAATSLPLPDSPAFSSFANPLREGNTRQGSLFSPLGRDEEGIRGAWTLAADGVFVSTLVETHAASPPPSLSSAFSSLFRGAVGKGTANQEREGGGVSSAVGASPRVPEDCLASGASPKSRDLPAQADGENEEATRPPPTSRPAIPSIGDARRGGAPTMAQLAFHAEKETRSNAGHAAVEAAAALGVSAAGAAGAAAAFAVSEAAAAAGAAYGKVASTVFQQSAGVAARGAAEEPGLHQIGSTLFKYFWGDEASRAGSLRAGSSQEEATPASSPLAAGTKAPPSSTSASPQSLVSPKRLAALAPAAAPSPSTRCGASPLSSQCPGHLEHARGEPSSSQLSGSDGRVSEAREDERAASDSPGACRSSLVSPLRGGGAGQGGLEEREALAARAGAATEQTEGGEEGAERHRNSEDAEGRTHACSEESCRTGSPALAPQARAGDGLLSRVLETARRGKDEVERPTRGGGDDARFNDLGRVWRARGREDVTSFLKDETLTASSIATAAAALFELLALLATACAQDKLDSASNPRRGSTLSSRRASANSSCSSSSLAPSPSPPGGFVAEGVAGGARRGACDAAESRAKTRDVSFLWPALGVPWHVSAASLCESHRALSGGFSAWLPDSVSTATDAVSPASASHAVAIWMREQKSEPSGIILPGASSVSPRLSSACGSAALPLSCPVAEVFEERDALVFCHCFFRPEAGFAAAASRGRRDSSAQDRRSTELCLHAILEAVDRVIFVANGLGWFRVCALMASWWRDTEASQAVSRNEAPGSLSFARALLGAEPQLKYLPLAAAVYELCVGSRGPLQFWRAGGEGREETESVGDSEESRDADTDEEEEERHFNDVFGEEEQSHRTVGFGAMESGDEKAQGAPVGRESETEEGARETFERDTVERRGERLEDGEQETPRRGRGRGRLDGVGEAENQPEMTVERGTLTATVEIPSVWRKPRETGSNFQERTCGASAKKRHSNHVLLSTKRTLVSSAGSSAHLSVVQRATVTSQIEILATACVAAFPAVLPWNVLAWIFRGAFSVQKRMVKEGEEATLWRGTPRGRATSLPAVLEREVLFNSPDGVWVRLVSHLLGAAGFADEATLERPRDAGEHTRRTTQRDTQSLSFLYAVSSGGSQRRADLSSSSFRASVSSGACLLFLPLAGLQLFRRYLARLRCSSSLPRLRLPGLQSLLALQAHFHLLGLSAHARRETHFPSLCRNSSSFSPNGAESHSSRPSHRIVPPSSFAASASDSPHQQKETGGERIRTSNHPEHSQECSDTSTQLLPSSGSSLDAAVLSHSRESASPAWCASQPLPGRASPHFWGPECSGGFDGEAAGSVGAFMSSLVEDAALASSNLENPMLLHPFSREVPEPTSQDSARASSRGCAAGTPPSVSSSRSTSPPRDSLASLPSFAASSVASAFGSFAGSASVSFAHSTGERSRAPALGQETQTDGPRERREAQEQLGDAQVSEQGETGGTDLERPICVRGRDGDSGEQEGNSENLVPGRRPDRETDVEKELAALFSLLEAALSLGSALHVCRLLSRHILPRLLASLVPSTSSASPFRPSSVSLPWMNNGKSGSAFSRDERQGLTAAELSRGSKEGGREGEGERDALSESGRLEGSGREEESKAADSARASKSESRQTGRSVAEGVSHAGEGRVCENREEHGKRAREILQVCLLRCAAFLAEGLAQTSFLPQSQEGDERRNREARSRGERSGEEERGSDGGGTQQESAGGVSSGFSSLSVAAEELETNATSGKGAVYPCSLSSSAQTKTPSGLSLDEVVNCFFLLHAALQALEARREESVTTARGKEGVNPARDETETASQAPCRANVRPADLVLLLLAASACHPGLAAFTATNRACERGNETRKETRTEGTREGEREQDSGGVGEGRDLHPKQRGKGGEAENRERSPPRRRREMSRTLFPADGEDASEAGDLSGWRVAVRGDSEETEEAREGREEQTLFRERQNAPTSDTSPPQSALHVAFFSHASRGAPRGAYRASPLNDRTPPSSVLSCAFSPVASSSSSSSRWSPTESRDVFDDAEKSGSEFSCEDARGSAGTQDDESRAGEPPAETPESLLEVLLAPPSSDPLRSLLERSSAFFKERGEGEDRSAREVQGERGARSERGRQDAGREETEADDEKMMEGKTADGEGRCKAEANRERRCACEVDKHSSECMQIVDWARGCFGPPSPCRHFAMATLLKLLERRASGGSSVHHTLGSSPSPWFSRAPQFLDAEKEACVLGDGKAGGDGEDKSDERDGGIALLTPEPVQRAVAIPVSVHLAFLSRAHALLAAISSHQRLHVASASKDRGVEEQGSADRGKTVRLVPDPGVLDLLTCVQKRAGPMPSPASENVAPIPSGEERFVSRSRNEEECFASPGGNGETVRREALCRRPVCSASSAFLLPAADAPGKTSSVPFFLSPISPSHAAPGDFWRLLSGLALAARGREPPWLLPAAADAARFASEDSHAEGELNLRAWGDGRGLRGGAQPDSFSRQSGGQRSSLRDSQLLAGALATLEAPRAPRPCDGVCGASEGQGDLFPAEECLYTGKADQPSTPGESVPGGPARKDELRRDLRVAASWQTQRAAAHSASSPLSQGSAAAFAPSQPLGAKGVFSGGGACVRGVGKAHRGPFPREGEPGCEPWAKLHAAVGGKGAALPLGVSESAESSERFLIRRKEALQDLAVRSRCDRRLPQRGANLESSTVAALAALEETMQKKWNRSFATREGEFHAAPREDAKVRQEREGSERKAIEKNTRERKKGTREERKEKERAEKNEETELSGDELPFGSPGRRGVCGDTAEENGKSGTGEQVRTAHPVPVSSRQSSERSSLTSPSPGNGQTRHVFSHPLA
ncbi:conserved hypothetical protein [Neospora caninum Liverpool]|uniref:Uncharacterized protein n=1 Tax=Neospora caninum (strain Liverpool) TaxID=572307 RepID=F0VBL3_NEOCL|nr:conserved hypothetical protein [Neospora caninum Liverpool]CBZ50997.1 conserved hypothetical protein [Neospora caninum Liverpool]|eukprot:XP_003881030.1 conserved hypothetical protein [Neospora caninum Liverpool]